MQSLTQAVRGFITRHSPEGVTKREIINEMSSRGYHTDEGQVDNALNYNSPFIKLKNNHYVKKIPYWIAKR